MLQVPRTVSNTLKVLQVLAEFPKFLVSVADTLEALQLCAKILKFPIFVSDFLEAPRVLAKIAKLLIFVTDSFGTSVSVSIIYKISTMSCSINALLASGGAGRPQ